MPPSQKSLARSMKGPISRIKKTDVTQLVPVAAADHCKQYRYSRDMFYSLLIVTFAISLAVSWGVVRLFDRPVAAISEKIFSDELGGAWHRYIKFAALVVGVSGGVRIQELELRRGVTSPYRLQDGCRGDGSACRGLRDEAGNRQVKGR